MLIAEWKAGVRSKRYGMYDLRCGIKQKPGDSIQGPNTPVFISLGYIIDREEREKNP
jgi:hypothetical protein